MGHTCRSPSASVKSLPPLLSLASRIRTFLNPASISVFAAVTPEIPQPITRIWLSVPAMLVLPSHWYTRTKLNATIPSDASLINTSGLCKQCTLVAIKQPHESRSNVRQSILDVKRNSTIQNHFILCKQQAHSSQKKRVP